LARTPRGSFIGDASTPTTGATLVLTGAATFANNITTSAATPVTSPLTISATGGITFSTGTFTLGQNLIINDTTTAINFVGGGNTGPVITGTGLLVFNTLNVNLDDAAGANSGWTGGVVVNSGTLQVPGSNNSYNEAVTVYLNAGANWGGSGGVGNSSNVLGGWQSGSYNSATELLLTLPAQITPLLWQTGR